MIREIKIPKIYFQLAFHKFARKPVRLCAALILLTGALAVGMTIATYNHIRKTGPS